ncbi:MAG: hypothetical protein U0905_11890 [Pirellulales bacterium]
MRGPLDRVLFEIVEDGVVVEKLLGKAGAAGSLATTPGVLVRFICRVHLTPAA